MKELEDAVKSIIADTKRNQLVWEQVLPYCLRTKTKLEAYNIVGEVNVELVQNRHGSLKEEVDYYMYIGKWNPVIGSSYEPLKEFGKYIFVD